ncbi:glycosyltransferase [Belliella marina]|uniref:Glycosyltransferase n=1 Tax=Belliella marina TaxID=1644146 RepID=A0ABW4VRQ3_9BACT
MKKNLKVAYFSGHVRIPSYGASSIHIMKMCSAYSQLGHKVTLFVSNIETEYSHEDEYGFYGVEKNFEIRKISLNNNSKIQFFQLSIWSSFKGLTGNYNVIHARNLATAWATAIIFKQPIVYEMHGMPENNAKSIWMFNQLINSKHCLFVIVITNLLKQNLSDFIKHKKEILVCPDGFSNFAISDESKLSAFKKSLSERIGTGKIALYTGHLYEGRGIELIIELAKSVDEVNFVVVGGRNIDVDKYRTLTFGIQNIHFLGFVPPSEVPYYQICADVLLMPYADKVFVPGGIDSSKYASPLKMFEYMNSGVPIISSKLPILSEILVNNQNCLMVEYSDVQGWINGIKVILSDEELSKRLSQTAKSQVQDFSWENRAKRIIEFIHLKLS